MEPYRFTEMYQVVRMLLSASVGLTEKQAREKGYELKLVNFLSLHQESKDFWNTRWFCKSNFDAKYGEWLDVT
jgi:dihydrolipoamide dehydrogenase